MKASTNIREMLAGNRIYVPTYQRAYSWETPREGSERKTQTDVFLSDLEENIRSNNSNPYYFGHFLFEEKENNKYAVIDGQQRLTTISIFLSVLFRCLKKKKVQLSIEDNQIFQDTIQCNHIDRFQTVEYDKDFFKDYVINQSIEDDKTLEYQSAKRIKYAYDYFLNKLMLKEPDELEKLLNSTITASCSTYNVKNESEAIQMFIFQNNRGKSPSALEILKANFMFAIHLNGGHLTNDLIEEVKRRFEKIYKSISAIGYKISEDEILNHTLRVKFNNLSEGNAIEKIKTILAGKEPIEFIKTFSMMLEKSFDTLRLFFGDDEKKHHEIHSIITLGGIGQIIPFIIKAYSFRIPYSEIFRLCVSLESIILRDRLIGTRADMTSRLNYDFQKFTKENPIIQPIIDRINRIKSESHWWWAHWNNKALKQSISGGLHHPTARFLLWKYENHLETKASRNGYILRRYDQIDRPELEHIAPKTKPGEHLASGYCEYDDEFNNQYLNCLGNYLLISKKHNCSIGNIPYPQKYTTYTYLKQQTEVQETSAKNMEWTKDNILSRKNKITTYIMENF
ncbi:DUF262 domain-containing protein [Pedobacter gandavensis]|uniref:DUF262 domain-containing protein n=1 Tax=Pedobacter gandavensis TaxID=2679963 RepID=UPI00292F01A3|nr:DUF262 domain-containing protein [Pedobacter gandavensis]